MHSQECHVGKNGTKSLSWTEFVSPTKPYVEALTKVHGMVFAGGASGSNGVEMS